MKVNLTDIQSFNVAPDNSGVTFNPLDVKHVKKHISRLHTWKRARKNINKNGRGNLDTADLENAIAVAEAWKVFLTHEDTQKAIAVLNVINTTKKTFST